jgi:hypothetical protein
MIRQTRKHCKYPEFISKEAQRVQEFGKALIKNGLYRASVISNEGHPDALFNRNPQVMRPSDSMKDVLDQWLKL